jgi:tetratricopeptide (TPR) repeat protein
MNKSLSTAPAVLFILCLLLTAPAFSSGGREGEVTPMADIINIINDSGNFEYHTTLLNSNEIFQEYKAGLGKSHPEQMPNDEGAGKGLTVYSPRPGAGEKVQKAAALLKKGDLPAAEKLLTEAARIDPGYSTVYVRLGEVFLDMDDPARALEMAGLAIQKRPLNFEAHRLRGRCLAGLGHMDDARDSFIQAIICGRNCKEAWDDLEELGRDMKFTLYRKPFVPVYSTQKMDSGKIRIYLDEKTLSRWMPYAFCKTVWRFHPGYFQARTGEEEYRTTYAEERECILNMLWAYEAFRKKGDTGEDPLLERMKAIDRRFFLREFIYFEVLSPGQPQVLPLLDSKGRDDLADYFREFILVGTQGR